MKRGLVLIAGVPIALAASFYISTRVVQPPNTAIVVATLKQDKLVQKSQRPLNRTYCSERVVPPAPLLPPAPVEPAAREPEPEPAPAPLPAPRRSAAVARHQRIRAALPVAVAVLIAVGLVAAAIALLSAFGADTNVRAPWDGPDAPVVHPAPLNDQ
jgi:hypothetical protein